MPDGVNYTIWRIVISDTINASYMEVCEEWTVDDLVEAHLLLNEIDRARIKASSGIK